MKRAINSIEFTFETKDQEWKKPHTSLLNFYLPSLKKALVPQDATGSYKPTKNQQLLDATEQRNAPSQDTPSVTRSSARHGSQFESHFPHDAAYSSYVVFASNPSRHGNRVRRLRRHVGANARYCTLEFVLAVSVTQQTERVCGNVTTTTGVRATRQAGV
jgi:hypothetical protein